MAAMTKAELETVTLKEWNKLDKLLTSVNPALALEKDGDDTSIKDVVGHRAHWIDLFFVWYHDGLAGKNPELPAPGYKWNQLKQYNTEIRRQQADLNWQDACALLAKKHQELIGWIGARSEDELYGAPMQGGGNDWRPGRWAEASGPSHYRSAAKYIRARQRNG